MTSDLEAFVQSLGVNTKSSGTNVGYNDFNVDCPYCGADKHLGIHRDSGQVKCWVCDFYGVRPRPTLAQLVSLWAEVPMPVARNMLRRAKYTGYQVKPATPHADSITWPEDCSPFDSVSKEHHTDRDVAYAYLKARRISIPDIESYQLRFTPRRRGYYSGRIIIPVTLGGLIVNWIGRDYTGTNRLTYKNARSDMTVVQMSSLLWGMDEFIRSGERWLRICEGFFDAATLGRIAVSVQKSKLSPHQLKLVRSAQPEAVSIIFDPATDRDQQVLGRALAAAQDVSAFVPRVKLVKLAGGDVSELGAKIALETEQDTPWLNF